MADALEEVDESTPRRPPMEPRATLNHRGPSSSARIGSDAYMRQLQTLRGSLPWKRVASKMLVESLETVRIEDLASQEKSCVICYNDFGAPTPKAT
ncbi:hypothetical protein B0I35DRAFT_473131 [Stachybotrys elegans]|uniref:Uncharacterized protein n=1 Tax=Stachybotrys elegans TaxID=80388 RepID=A0A8K0T1I7_9HYPO|nr:hypothetical protein B0I35DRAFT_473131 [Stachybotrys elegans]